MTYPHPFLRLVVSGSLYDTETFAWSLAFIQNTTTPTAPAEVPPALISALTTFWQQSGGISAFAKIRSVKLNLIGEDGRYANQQTVEYEPDPPIGGSAQVTIAPQLALVVSLGTAFRRGRAHAGRFYLPLPGTGLGTDGRLPANFTGTLAQTSRVMLDEFNTALGPDWRVGVVSDLGTGNAHRVTHVRVGRVLDTLRSRRSSLNEEYSQSDLVTPGP